MGVLTKIQWTDHTWNPWRGCFTKSEGCKFCYAEVGAKRNPRVLGTWGPNGRRAIAAESYWRLPLRWNKEAQQAGRRRRVFALSLGDWLELREDLRAPRARLLATIAMTPWLDWLLLTKRPENWRAALEETPEIGNPVWDTALDGLVGHWLKGLPPSNVRAGVSVENQARADERYELALRIPAFSRFFSCEPLLSSIWFPSLRGIDWVIIGGGPNARPCDPRWIRCILEQCRAHGAAAFVKQLGANVEGTHLQDPKGGDPDEWPEDLRIREFPA